MDKEGLQMNKIVHLLDWSFVLLVYILCFIPGVTILAATIQMLIHLSLINPVHKQ